MIKFTGQGYKVHFNMSWSPTYGGNDGTTEEEGRCKVPAAGEVGREAAHVQACVHSRHHTLQEGGGGIYLCKWRFLL